MFKLRLTALLFLGCFSWASEDDTNLRPTTVLPRLDNYYDLGSSAYRWRNGYFGGALDVDGSITSAGAAITGTITLSGTWDGWIGANETWTFVSSTQFSVTGDQTGKYKFGDKIKLTQTSAKYFYVTASAFTSVVTTVTVNGGTDYTLANATISSPFYSRSHTPVAFPHWFNYATTYTGWTADTPSVQDTRFSISGRSVSVIWTTPSIDNGTSNSTSTSMTVPVAAKSDVIMPVSAYDGANILGLARTNAASTTVTLYHDTALGAWAAAGSKAVRASFTYEAN